MIIIHQYGTSHAHTGGEIYCSFCLNQQRLQRCLELPAEAYGLAAEERAIHAIWHLATAYRLELRHRGVRPHPALYLKWAEEAVYEQGGHG